MFVFLLHALSCVCDRRATYSVKSVASREENTVHLINIAGYYVVLFITQSMIRLNKTANVTQHCITPDFAINMIYDCLMVHV